MGNFTLKRIDIKPNIVISESCTCIDHCKELARKTRNKDIYGYNEMQFEISFYDRVYYRSVKNSGWRIIWDKV